MFLIRVRLLLLVSICGERYLMFGVLCVWVMFFVNLFLMCFMLVLLMVSFVKFLVCFLFVLWMVVMVNWCIVMFFNFCWVILVVVMVLFRDVKTFILWTVVDGVLLFCIFSSIVFIICLIFCWFMMFCFICGKLFDC